MTLTVNQKEMVYWINERESIRKKKELGELAPWSDNPVMQVTYFCNVNREDDKVTKWIRDNWLYNGDEAYDVAMTVARICHSPETLRERNQPTMENLHRWCDELLPKRNSRKDSKLKVWGGAYMITTGGKKIDKGLFTSDAIKKLAISPNLTHNVSSLAEAHSKLLSVDGIGEFLAGQVVADLKNTIGHKLSKSKDWWTFSVPGPGSLRGLSWFFDENVTRSKYQVKIREAFEILEYELPEEILDILCFQNLQNCFCEYDKFMKATKGKGRSKRNYNGKGENQ